MFKTIHPIPAFYDNYIWAISDSGSNSVAVVDPGDAQPVLSYIEANQLLLTDILITHHHADHTGGLLELAGQFPVAVHGPKNKNIKGISNQLSEGDRVELFGHHFTVIEVPGHTLDHIAYYCDETEPPTLFCGDTLFAAGCGRLFEGTPKLMHQSLEKLKSLNSDTRVFCTHEYTMANLDFAKAAEPDNSELLRRIEVEQEKRQHNQPTLPSSLQLELETNPFLRCGHASLTKSASERLGQSPDDEVAVFAALREWKDNF